MSPASAARLCTISRHPCRPQTQRGPVRSTTVWPNSPALVCAPRWAAPPSQKPPPMPDSTMMSAASPNVAPCRQASAVIPAVTSLSRWTGRPRCFSAISRSGTSCQWRRPWASRTRPLAWSSGPIMPMPSPVSRPRRSPMPAIVSMPARQGVEELLRGEVAGQWADRRVVHGAGQVDQDEPQRAPGHVGADRVPAVRDEFVDDSGLADARTAHAGGADQPVGDQPGDDLGDRLWCQAGGLDHRRRARTCGQCAPPP